MNRILLFMLVFGVTKSRCDEETHYAFKYGGMEQQDSVKDYFDIAVDEVKHKDGSDSIFIINGNVQQKLDLDDGWKTRIVAYFFYATMKECSNLPDPDTCPIAKEQYKMTNCEFDANVFRKLSKPGFYKVNADLLQNDEVKTGVVVRGSVYERE